MADKRLWFKLDVGYIDNPKISELVDDHPRAIVLHLACIAYAKQHGTDGRVPMRLAMRRACAEQCDLDACIELGIIRMDGDAHLMVHDYTRHQGTAEADQTRSDKARRAAQARWDRAQRTASSNAPSTAGSNATRNAEREEKSRTHASPAGDAQFDEWWQAYPRKIGKGQARKAYKTAAKKTDHASLLAAAVSFAQKTKGADPKFIAHPTTWLNGERWDDQDDNTDGRVVTTGDGERWDLGEWA